MPLKSVFDCKQKNTFVIISTTNKHTQAHEHTQTHKQTKNDLLKAVFDCLS